MNRKQKKAKRLKATQHTKSNARYKPTQPVVFNRQSAEACLARDDAFGRAVHEAARKTVKRKSIFWGLFFILPVVCLILDKGLG